MQGSVEPHGHWKEIPGGVIAETFLVTKHRVAACNRNSAGIAAQRNTGWQWNYRNVKDWFGWCHRILTDKIVNAPVLAIIAPRANCLESMRLQKVENARLAKEIVLSPHFRMYSMADRYRELVARTGLDFSASIRLMEYLPVFIDGEHHVRIRKAMARRVSQTQKCQYASCAEALASVIHRFADESEVELVEDFAQPIWRAISASIMPRTPETLRLIDDIPNLFSPILSIKRRFEINQRIEAFQRNTGEEEEDELILLCLTTLEMRPFVGTLSLSIYDLVGSNAGKSFAEVEWPETFPVSSLRYVDRIALCDVSVGGRHFSAGERVRCFTQHVKYSREENAGSLFGFGSHTCLGKSVSERVWKLVTATLSKLSHRPTSGRLSISKHNDPFYMPNEAWISLR